ncbi:uncharacterized protein PRCAT00005510001 [Priceomyces carsonii]|uniref:uncharacterized protein n=1 Tax=Priceomyces carsonii TaxID=28549 RepID=UPI002ED8AF8F|nr:unnamed protein product [Priceomyces carsonii]
MKSTVWNLTVLFLLLKLSQVLIVYFVPSQFDTSSEIVIEAHINSKYKLIESSRYPNITEYLITNILDKVIRWDAVYFTDLFFNEIKFEHQFVFCPLYWRMIKSIPFGENNFYTKLIVSLIVNNISHYLASLILFALTRTIFKNFTQNEERLQKLSFYSSASFIVSQAGIFLTANYAESPCCLLSFISMYLREISLNYRDFSMVNSKMSLKQYQYKLTYLLSGSFVALNYGFRANALLLGIFYLYDTFEFMVRNHNLKDSLWLLASGSQLFFSFVWINWLNYEKFCPERGEWCNNMVPSLFSFAQTHYWNVGFLRYWSSNNIPNFLFALPTIIISLLSFRYFFQINPTRILLPYVMVNFSLIILGLLFWHVQILTRVSSFLPLCNWFIASLLISNNQKERSTGMWIIKYSVVWNLVQTALFAEFLPPA